MKQIILESQAARPVCGGRLFVLWGLFGVASATLWKLAGSDPLAQAAVWAVEGVAALGLLLALEV